uniref:Helicase ATP-binding domain-containing protein n=1 Tax=Heterorhabditis bacteriophora TaxID=37862 RepID=A0A1I7WLZ9_HETBA
MALKLKPFRNKYKSKDEGAANNVRILAERRKKRLAKKEQSEFSVESVVAKYKNLVNLLECLWRAKWSSECGLGALIISPTRELALQTFTCINHIGKYHHFSCALLIGGISSIYVILQLVFINLLCIVDWILPFFTHFSFRLVVSTQRSLLNLQFPIFCCSWYIYL